MGAYTQESLNVSDKVLTLICNRRLIKREYIKPETTFEELGINSPIEKEEFVWHIVDRFLLPTEGRLLNFIVNGAYVKDNFCNHLRIRIKNVMDVIKLIEGNDDKRGKPAAYNI